MIRDLQMNSIGERPAFRDPANGLGLAATYQQERYTMRVWIGKSILLIAAIHTVFGLVVFRSTILEIISDGVFNTINGQPGREYAFWFIACGFCWFLLGWLVDYIERLGSSLPRFFGPATLLLTLLSIFIMPASGFWLALIPALGMILRQRRLRVV